MSSETLTGDRPVGDVSPRHLDVGIVTIPGHALSLLRRWPGTVQHILTPIAQHFGKR